LVLFVAGGLLALAALVWLLFGLPVLGISAALSGVPLPLGFALLFGIVLLLIGIWLMKKS
jgi:TRAP-type C4-dicarboxylate transport system permease small subunit